MKIQLLMGLEDNWRFNFRLDVIHSLRAVIKCDNREVGNKYDNQELNKLIIARYEFD